MYHAHRSLLVLILASGIVLGGCASNQVASPVKPDAASIISLSMQEADRMVEGGNQKDAVKLLGDLTRRFPDRKEAWVRLAKLHFEAGEYARAIIAAEEAVQRDPSDRSVKTIRAVSGLRVASQSLNDLRGDIELKGDAKADAVGLVKVMRETLGEDVLVPQDEKKKKVVSPSTPKPKAKPAAVQGSVSGSPASAGPGGSGNPFGALK